MEAIEVVPAEKQKISGERTVETIVEIASVVHAAFVAKRWIKLGIGALRAYNASR